MRASPWKRMNVVGWTGRLALLVCVTIASGESVAGAAKAPAPNRPKATNGDRWGPVQAAHLLRRAGFGGTPEQIRYLTDLGKKAAVNTLVDYEDIPFDHPAFEVPSPAGLEIRRVLRNRDQEQRKRVRAMLRRSNRMMIEDLRAWWLQRMIATPRPLEEKMTLFWHGLLTSGFQEIKHAPLLAVQNDFLRKHAMADFRTILVGVSKDPAMLLYLNNAQNNKRHANENYARELMELFTLGEGNYTEADVTEAARAFTGWGVRRETWSFQFHRKQHDFGEKTVLGKSGNFNGEDIIDILLKQPAASRHLAGRLWKFFAGTDPPANAREAIAANFRETDFNVREAVRTLLMQDAFYDAEVVAAKIKSPVELMVGAIRALEATPADLIGLSGVLRQMGQSLFQPPNVKGWDGGRKWITTSTLYTRYNAVGALIGGSPGGRAVRSMRRPLGPRIQAMMEEMDLPEQMVYKPQVEIGAQPEYDPMPILERENLGTAEEVVDHLVERLLAVPLAAEKRTDLIALLNKGGSFDPSDDDAAEKIRVVLTLLMSTPEFQLG